MNFETVLKHESALQVFLEFADIESSTKAKNGMHGRKFANNQVVAVFYPEDKFAEGQYDG
jgi:splicing factor U2AF subunit